MTASEYSSARLTATAGQAQNAWRGALSRRPNAWSMAGSMNAMNVGRRSAQGWQGSVICR